LVFSSRGNFPPHHSAGRTALLFSTRRVVYAERYEVGRSGLSLLLFYLFSLPIHRDFFSSPPLLKSANCPGLHSLLYFPFFCRGSSDARYLILGRLFPDHSPEDVPFLHLSPALSPLFGSVFPRNSLTSRKPARSGFFFAPPNGVCSISFSLGSSAAFSSFRITPVAHLVCFLSKYRHRYFPSPPLLWRVSSHHFTFCFFSPKCIHNSLPSLLHLHRA